MTNLPVALSPSVSAVTSQSTTVIDPIQTPFGQEVWRWGGVDPWTANGIRRLDNRAKFGPAEMITDGLGNIAAQPLLEGKPCFGRIETWVRHGKRIRKAINGDGKAIETSQHRCGRCAVREACSAIVGERIKSDPDIQAALVNLVKGNQLDKEGRISCVGPDYGRRWEFLKLSVIARGPFETINDIALAQIEAERVAVRREKWVRRQRRHRERERADRRDLGKGVTPTLLRNLEIERDHRIDIMIAATAAPTALPSIRRISASDLPKTAALTANAWMASEILSADGSNVTPGRVARWLVERGLAQGKSYIQLKARIYNDLHRVRELESGHTSQPVWPPFDPDVDLAEAFDNRYATAPSHSRNDIESYLDDGH